MLAVKLAREALGHVAEAQSVRQQPRNRSRIGLKFREAAAQKALLCANYRDVDQREQKHYEDGNRNIAGSDGESYGDHDRTQVQRIADVSVRTRRRQLFILIDVS